MKRVLFICSLALCATVSAKTYYVAPNGGSDVYPGTIIQPWATWQKAFETANTGDTVYFRGGVWYPTTHHGGGYAITEIDPGAGIGHNGTYDNPICYSNYPGETPILDCSMASSAVTGNIGININEAKYLKFKGLTIRNVRMLNATHNVSGIEMKDCYGGYMSFENLTVHNIGGAGYWLAGYDTLHLTNCDSYECCDSLDINVPGGDGDGYNISSGGTVADTFKIAFITGCRSWNNSDDGLDLGTTKQFVISNCWSFHNGYQFPTSGADGNGFKLAGSHVFGKDKRIIHHSLSAFNGINNAAGFATQNLAVGPSCSFYNNISYQDYIGFNTAIPIGWDCTTDPGGEIWRNNIIYGQTSAYPYLIYACNNTYLGNNQVVIDHNSHIIQDSWPYSVANTAFTITREDFVLSDPIAANAELTAVRKTDGSLPDITFMKLKETSDLINAGIDVGLPYYGTAPDLGYSEFLSGSINIPPTPNYVNSVIENATPSRLEMTYNITLVNIAPTLSSFTVKINNVVRSVSNVAISGAKVLLTLASPVSYGDNITVAYNKPANNPLQTSAGGQAASITAQIVTNNVSAISPVYVNSVVENATPSRLEMFYNLTLANIVPTASAFTVTVNSSTKGVSAVAISGTKVQLTLPSPIAYGDIVTVAYTKPFLNPLQIAAGGQAASVPAQNVTNNCIAPSANQSPSASISSPTKSTSFISPATITIDAIASDPDGTVTKVEFYNGTVKLGERTVTPYSFSWKEVTDGTYSITAVATDNQNARSTSPAVSVVVEKAAVAINQPPVVSITSPNKNKKYRKNENIVIKALASDPDGTVSKVEFKNGNSTIAQLTSAPYIYIWEDVDTGTYIITAIVTDNLGAINVSSEMELKVEDFYDVNSEILNLYPNPNNGHFSISFYSSLLNENNKVSVINLAGKTVYNDVIAKEETSREFDLPDTAAGTYVLMVTSGNVIVTTKKFVKK